MTKIVVAVALLAVASASFGQDAAPAAHIGDEGSLDAGEGAAAGAAVGAAKGRRAQKKAGKQAQAQQSTQTQGAQSKETFKKAWGACLEGRSYSVK